MNIVVLAGGISTEREVSINTGYMVCGALRKIGHNAILVDVYFGTGEDCFDKEYDLEQETDYIKTMSDKIEDTKASGKSFFGENVLKICKYADVVFMALHGENGENGKIQAAFDLHGIKYTGTGYLGSALAMDKGLSKQLFEVNQIPSPKGMILKESVSETNSLPLPCVVKPCCGGSSVGVSIVNTWSEYIAALKEAFRYEPEVVVEEYIKGREFSIGVLGGEALPIIEIVPGDGFYDYEHKYTAGRSEEICPAVLEERIGKKMQETAVKVGEVLKLGTYYRADFLLDDEGAFYCLEANTLPGMTATSLIPQEAQAAGISFEQLCQKIIELSLQKY